MPTAEQDAIVAAKANRDENGEWDWEAYKAVYERGLAERQERLRRDARESWRAMDGWGRVKDQADWLALVDQAEEGITSGRFLIDRLGAERYLEPELMATLIVLRRRILTEHQVTAAADILLVDTALLAYYHQLRINGWIGNFAILLESDAFGLEGPRAKLREKYGYQVEGLKVEETIARIGEQLLPLLDRCNRLLIRNLRALRDPRQRPAASVSIGSVGQVNVGAQQVNVTEGGPGPSAEPPPKQDGR
jgi:hypothetical protein